MNKEVSKPALFGIVAAAIVALVVIGTFAFRGEPTTTTEHRPKIDPKLKLSRPGMGGPPQSPP